MSKDIAILPTFTPADIANARAYAIANGNAVGVRGRLPQWALNEWHAALRPTLVSVASATRVPGARGRRSTLDMDGTTRVVTKADAQNARAWAISEGIPVPTRGRMSTDTVRKWIAAGEPVAREEVATVYYRKLDKRGRPNGKEQIGVVYRDMLDRAGKPRMRDYWQALNVVGIPVRIVAGDMLITVTRDDEGTLSYSWVSKRDSKTVVDTLLSHVSM